MIGENKNRNLMLILKKEIFSGKCTLNKNINSSTYGYCVPLKGSLFTTKLSLNFRVIMISFKLNKLYKSGCFVYCTLLTIHI